MSGEDLNAMARLGGQYAGMGVTPDWDDEDDWSDPIPDGARHVMTVNDDGLLTCCHRNPHSLPRGDWQTADPDRVTCDRIKVTP